jgi:hypothetical protein
MCITIIRNTHVPQQKFEELTADKKSLVRFEGCSFDVPVYAGGNIQVEKCYCIGAFSYHENIYKKVGGEVMKVGKIRHPKGERMFSFDGKLWTPCREVPETNSKFTE